jgi:hypothetical protein
MIQACSGWRSPQRGTQRIRRPTAGVSVGPNRPFNRGRRCRAPHTGSQLFKPSGRLRAGLVVVRTIALSLRVGFAHVLTLFGLAIPPVACAVVHLGGRVDPDHSRAAAGSRGLARYLCPHRRAGRWGSWCGSSLGPCGWCCRGSCRWWSCCCRAGWRGAARAGGRSRSCSGRSSLVHATVVAACTPAAVSCRRTVLAEYRCRSRGRIGGTACQRKSQHARQESAVDQSAGVANLHGNFLQ